MGTQFVGGSSIAEPSGQPEEANTTLEELMARLDEEDEPAVGQVGPLIVPDERADGEDAEEDLDTGRQMDAEVEDEGIAPELVEHPGEQGDEGRVDRRGDPLRIGGKGRHGSSLRGSGGMGLIPGGDAPTFRSAMGDAVC